MLAIRSQSSYSFALSTQFVTKTRDCWFCILQQPINAKEPRTFDMKDLFLSFIGDTIMITYERRQKKNEVLQRFKVHFENKGALTRIYFRISQVYNAGFMVANIFLWLPFMALFCTFNSQHCRKPSPRTCQAWKIRWISSALKSEFKNQFPHKNYHVYDTDKSGSIRFGTRSDLGQSPGAKKSPINPPIQRNDRKETLARRRGGKIARKKSCSLKSFWWGKNAKNLDDRFISEFDLENRSFFQTPSYVRAQLTWLYDGMLWAKRT